GVVLEDVQDDIAEVAQHPPPAFAPFGADGGALGGLLHLQGDVVSDGARVGGAAGGADHKVVSNDGEAAHLEDANVGGLLFGACGGGDARGLQGVYSPVSLLGGACRRPVESAGFAGGASLPVYSTNFRAV